MSAPPAQHRVSADGDGPPVLVKEAVGPDGVGRLGAEAAVLGALDHPGVVRLVGLDVSDDVARLSLAWVGPHTLATVTGMPVRDAATIVADVADTVADLHRAGLRHGRLTPDHVLLGPHGRPVLTGFAEARALSGPADVRTDTVALGALLTALIATSEDTGPIPDRRRGRRSDSGQRATLLTLADRAQDGPEDDALDPAGLSQRIRQAIGEPMPRRVPAIPSPARRSDGPTGAGPRRANIAHRIPVPPRRAVLAGALGAAVLATAGAALWLRPDDRQTTRTTATTPTTTAPQPSASAPARADEEARPAPAPAPTTTAAPPCPPPSGAAVADVDGDGCPEDVVIDGERVTVDGTTWVAGRPGDTVVVGDWDCDGVATVASLRPSSGEVFLFPRWSASGEDLTVGPATTVADARTLQAIVTGDGCHDLVAVDAAGTPTVVEEAA